MPSPQDTFQQGQTVTTGPFTGAYLWSNAANWVSGTVPISGDSVSNAAGGFNFDDIAELDLGSLTQSADADTDVVATSLTVGTITSSGELVADAFEAGAPVRVQIGTIAGTGGVYTADDTGALLVDLSAVDPGNNIYATISGGFVTLAAAPASTSTLSYIDGPGTFALENPAATTATAVNGVVDGDVLELPGSSVSNVVFGTNSLTITTNVSSYTFSNVTYDETINSYVAAPDASTGLEAITFGTTETFQQGQTATTGPFTGAYLWSNAANWVSGTVPISGDSVSNAAGGFNFDDIAELDLGSLTQGADADTDVVATSLTVGTITSSGDLVADAFEAGAPVRVQIGTIAGTGGVYTADDTGALLVDLSAVDPGNNIYATISGGFVTLAAAPASTSTLSYIDGPGIFALENPAATTATAVNGVVDGDVLELPGSSVSNVVFGTNSLTVTTNVSSYTFSNVTYDETINSYVAAPDASTGLEAITFGTTQTFQQGQTATTGPFTGAYLWSNAANWVSGTVPISGDSVSNAFGGSNIDNIAGLELGNLTQSADAATEIATAISLTITGSVDGTGELTVGSGSTLALGGSVASGQTIALTGSGDVLQIGGESAFDGSISGFGSTGIIDVQGIGLAQSAVKGPGNELSLWSGPAGSGTDLFSFPDITSIPGADGVVSLPLVSDGDGGTVVACYLRGTRIRTDRGEVPIELLSVGDHVVTLARGSQPIRWIGRRRYVLAQTERHDAICPVLIRAGAIANGVPRRDLLVSPEHALYLDGVLVPARQLVNGASIVRCSDFDELVYFHIELTAHAIVFAEGQAAETFVDCQSRTMFDNAMTYNGGGSPPWMFCAPRVEAGELLADLRHRLALRAGLAPGDWRAGTSGPLIGNLERASPDFVEGWAQDVGAPECPVRLEIIVDGALVARVLANRHRNDLAAAGLGSGRHGFRVSLSHAPRRVEARRSDDGALLGVLTIG